MANCRNTKPCFWSTRGSLDPILYEKKKVMWLLLPFVYIITWFYSKPLAAVRNSAPSDFNTYVCRPWNWTWVENTELQQMSGLLCGRNVSSTDGIPYSGFPYFLILEVVLRTSLIFDLLNAAMSSEDEELDVLSGQLCWTFWARLLSHETTTRCKRWCLVTWHIYSEKNKPSVQKKTISFLILLIDLFMCVFLFLSALIGCFSCQLSPLWWHLSVVSPEVDNCVGKPPEPQSCTQTKRRAVIL